MKMQNAEMEFISFGAQDVITSSGGGNWFQMSGFTDPTGWMKSNTNFSVEVGNDYYSINPRDTSGQRITGAQFDTIYQLSDVPSATNKVEIEEDKGGGYIYNAYVVADKVATGSGTQITTWEGILEWITNHKVQ